MKVWSALTLGFTLSACTLLAQGLTSEERAAVQRELQRPVQVFLKNGQKLSGYSIDVSNDSLQIATASGAGEIVYTFQSNQIERFEAPGEFYKTTALDWIRAGESEKAVGLIDLLYGQRAQLIPMMPPVEANFYSFYVDLLVEANPAKSIAVANRILPYVDNPKALEMIESATMESYHDLEMHAEAHALAEQWITTHSAYASSALGYYILSLDAIRAEDFQSAIDLALQPIVFSNASSKEKLAECYAVAIAAAIGLRDKDYAEILYTEMQERELLWPTYEKALQPFYEKLLKQLEDA